MEIVGIEKAGADAIGERLGNGGLAAARYPRDDDPFRIQFEISRRPMLSQEPPAGGGIVAATTSPWHAKDS
jgi:hypothetical protein